MKLIDFSVTFIFTILNIGILFIVLRAIFFKPITKFIAARKEKIQEDLDQASAEREEVKRLMTAYEEKMNAAQDEIRTMTENSRSAAEKRCAAIIAEAKSQADAMIEAARKQITAENHAALLVFKAEAAALVMKAASRLVQREITAEDSRRLAAQILNENNQR